MNQNNIKNLKKHMLDYNYINSFNNSNTYCYNKDKNKDKSLNENKYKKSNDDICDLLFFYWCIISNQKFDLHQFNNSVKVKQYKIEVAESIKNEKNKIKEFKISSLINMEEQLVSDNKINIFTFCVLSSLTTNNVVVSNNFNVAFKIINNDSEKIFFVKKNINDNNYNHIEEINTFDKLPKLYFVENIKKPIKSITNYKLMELKTIYSILMNCLIESIGKKNKNELYEKIIQHCSF